MIISLKKLLLGGFKKASNVNDTAVTAPIENSITTVKTASDTSLLLVSQPTFFESFFGKLQINSCSLFKLFELSHHQRFKVNTFDVLVLKLFFVVVKIRDRGGHGSSIIRKNGDYDSFQALRLLYTNNND
jgi:hypothetical protein